MEIYNKYVSSIKTPDVFKYKNKNILRGEFKQYAVSNTPESKSFLQQICEKKKIIQSKYIIQNEIKNPFEILQFNNTTEIQKYIISIAPTMTLFGSYSLGCSCGSGKTLAAIYLIYYLKVKTLIISNRTSINDQWKYIINILYPHLKIKDINSKKSIENPDIYIYSPQYLTNDLDNFPVDIQFIIYDEIHSLTSKIFSQVLTTPMMQVLNGKRDELPFSVCLTATFPIKSSKEYNLLYKLFGKPQIISSYITTIPVNIWDARNHYKRDGKIEEEALGKFDKKYIPMDDYEFIDFCINHIQNKEIISDNKTLYKNTIDNSLLEALKSINPLFDINHKGFIITSTIDSSVYAWLKFHSIFKVGVLLIRNITEKCYYLAPEDELHINDIQRNITFDKTIGKKINNINDILPNVSIVFGTYHRLKEGISIENATWGICTKFLYSLPARIQIIGRIRRTSNSEDVMNSNKLFIVNSMSITTNELSEIMKSKFKHKKIQNIDIKPLYDFELEKELFKYENYAYI